MQCTRVVRCCAAYTRMSEHLGSSLARPCLLKRARHRFIIGRFVSPADGFLSENADFSAAVAEAGAAFVGPNAHAISAMGDKIESKRLAASAGVSTIPGIEVVLKNADEAVEVANQVGYPVMLKASAGGGGKGMRIAYNDEEARSGFALSAVSVSPAAGFECLLPPMEPPLLAVCCPRLGLLCKHAHAFEPLPARPGGGGELLW